VIRGIATAIITIFMVSYVSVQLVASGKILSETFGWEYHSALLLGFAIITFYTLMGGFFAVAWTDVFQGMLIVIILVVLPLIGLIHVGGFDGLFFELGQMDVDLLSPGYGYSGWLFLLFVMASMAWILGYPGQPHILTRYMAIKEEKKLVQSTLIGMIWVIIALWGAVLLGIIGLVVFKGLPDPESVMPLLATTLLPQWAAGVVIAAITAAIMSTADSQLLVATSAIVEDVYHKLINPKASQKTLVLYSRILVMVLSIFALLLALQGGVIYFLVAFAWGGLAASFGPLVILSLWWKKTTKSGAIAGMLSGTAVVILWDKMGISTLFSSEIIIPGMLPAFAVAFVCIVVVSMITVPPKTTQLFQSS
jgi:sodium/proline symporter